MPKTSIRKTVFYSLLILIPFVLLSLFEILLRLTGYGDDLNFVSIVERNGKKYYTINQLVGKRYFGKDRLYFRKGVHDFFEVNKSPNTIRIFLFGESTTAGFPYEYNAIPSEFLLERLVNAFPGKRIEVINTAIAAINSFTVAEFAKEMVHYNPDLFIFYMGQNEFYGVFGVGSTMSVGSNRWIIKTYLWLQHFKIFILLKNTINSLAEIFNSGNPGENQILMEQMIKNHSIGLNSKEYITALNTFRKNFQEIIETAGENKIPVIISTLVTNEKDLQPFVSMYSADLTHEKKSRYLEFYNDAKASKNIGEYQKAISNFKKALKIDNLPAITHFELAECYYKINDFISAEREFTLAKDLDGLKFRAPGEFNNVIKDISGKYNIPLADISGIFRKYSKNSIVGDELLIDHVHPNVKGYFLMAKTWYESIKNNNLLKLSPGFNENDSLLWRNSTVTYLDSLIGEIKIKELKSMPPYTKKKQDINFELHTLIDSIAYKYTVLHQISWGKAHLAAAGNYLAGNDLNHALKEYQAILITDDESPYILTMEGDLYFKLGAFSKAEESYQHAFSLDYDNRYIKYKLGIVEHELGRIQLSIEYLNNCLISNNSSNIKLDPEIINDIYYYLALNFIENKEYQKAVSELKALLKNNPGDNKAEMLLLKVNSLQKEH
jgi:tetratricopeptide (TPR) repeat protein